MAFARRLGMRIVLTLILIPALALTACKKVDDESETDAPAEMGEPIGSYDVDPESGEVSATHTDAAGVTTTMRAGEKVEARFPEPFTAYPGAQITNTTRVEQGDGAFITVEFTTEDTRDAVVEFYRKQASKANIVPDIEVSGGATTTLGGDNRQQEMRFALQVTRVSQRTEGQLTVARGFD